MIQLIVALISSILLLVCPDITVAHKPSDSYLHLEINENVINGQWDIALRDLDYAIGLDANDDGALSWGEVRTQQDHISSYALSRLHLKVVDSGCWNQMENLLIDRHSDGAYAVLQFSANCPSQPANIHVQYGLFFDIDSLHRGLLQIHHEATTQTAVFSPERPAVQFDLTAQTFWREFLQFSREGVWHIWIGFDHILFLISLLLPSVLLWKSGQWEGAESFRQVLSEVLSIVTAFTLAHSITLSVATMGLVTLPSRWVESVIAGSVVLAAMHNLFPVIHIRRWIVGFVFGLIHGFGFASVLTDLRLPTTSLFVALAGFNIGVEAGQLVIVSVFLPLAYAIRHSWSYRYLVMQLGSTCIAGLALIWLIERSLNLSFANWLW